MNAPATFRPQPYAQHIPYAFARTHGVLAQGEED